MSKKEKKKDEINIPDNEQKSSWFKSMFKIIGNFFNKLIGTIIQVVSRPLNDEDVKVDENFLEAQKVAYEKQSNHSTLPDRQQRPEPIIESEPVLEENFVPETPLNEEPENINMPVTENAPPQNNEETQEESNGIEDKIDSGIEEDTTDNIKEISQDPKNISIDDIVDDAPEETPQAEQTPKVEQTPKAEQTQETTKMDESEKINEAENMKEIKKDVVPVKFEGYKDLMQDFSFLYPDLKIDTMMPVLPEDPSDIVVIANLEGDTVTFSIDDTYDDALGIKVIAEKMSEQLSVSKDEATYIINQLQLNEDLVKQYTGEKRLQTIKEEVMSAKIETKEDLIQMALDLLNTPDRNKARIEETRENAFFVFPQNGSDFDDPNKIEISNEIKINLNDLTISKTVEFYDFITNRNEREENALLKSDLPPTLNAIFDVLENNKDFIFNEFAQPVNAPKETSENSYTESDEVLDDYRNKKNRKPTKKDIRRNCADINKFEEDVESGEAFKTKKQKRAERARFVPHNDDRDY